MPNPTHPFGCRKTILGSLRQQGRHEEVKRLITEAFVESQGHVMKAAWLCDFMNRRQFNRYRHYYPELNAVLAGIRARRRAAPKWLARTLAVLEGGRMSTIEKILEAAAGMTVDEIRAEVEASVHAADCDPQAVAEAIAASAG